MSVRESEAHVSQIATASRSCCFAYSCRLSQALGLHIDEALKDRIDSREYGGSEVVRLAGSPLWGAAGCSIGV